MTSLLVLAGGRRGTSAELVRKTTTSAGAPAQLISAEIPENKMNPPHPPLAPLSSEYPRNHNEQNKEAAASSQPVRATLPPLTTLALPTPPTHTIACVPSPRANARDSQVELAGAS